AERLGVGYDDVREYNSEVIYCSLSGYGQEGPYEERVGHDLNYVGFAGLLDMTRESEDEKPAVPGYPIADMSGGVFAALSIVSALLSRELGEDDDGERGEYIDVSMTDTTLSLSQAVTNLVFADSGDEPRPGETPLTGEFPWYDIYETKDGRYVTLAALEPKFWQEFCDAVGRDDLAGYHMTTDEDEIEELRDELNELFKGKTRDEWEDELGDKEVMFGVVNTPAEAVENEQIRERGIVRDDGSIPRVGLPLRTSEEPQNEGGVADRGEHTRELLRGCGYSDDEVDELEEKGVV
ncbi:MAG: CaiB/BaiF CoA-transferase family protein, partial [Halobacteria archaeon]|nr:CaiB/BaiF CoA-transferase family protein [Halobacteria archaeon]